MRILLTNDDGIDADGLLAIEKELGKLGKVTVVAPDRGRSAASHSLTLHRPIVVHRLTSTRFSVEGTPADCVKLACRELMPKPPDLVVSGINRGLNTGCNILYSGTVAGAFEGCLMGVSSVAVSLEVAPKMDFAEAARLSIPVIRRLPTSTPQVFNVNVPALRRAKIKGVRVTAQEEVTFKERFQKRSDPRGRAYYWLEAQDDGRLPDDAASNGTLTDERAIQAGYISVTPLKRNLTAGDRLKDLEQRLRLK